MIGKRLGVLVLTVGLGLPAWAQKRPDPTTQPQVVTVEQPDAERTKEEFRNLLDKYPPNLRAVFKEDPTLMTQQQYLAPYPALATYLTQHPEIPLNPSFYLDGLAGSGPGGRFQDNRDAAARSFDMWNDFLHSLEIFAGFALAIWLLCWLIRTFIDYRRWNRLSRVQQEVHTKLLDRFGTNEELMAYISTSAGQKFLQSAPITLDSGASMKAMAAPLSRILWSIQAGLVLAAAGGGFMIASGRVSEDMYLPLEILGIIAAALGVGFVVSAAVSYVLSWKLGLLDRHETRRTSELPEA